VCALKQKTARAMSRVNGGCSRKTGPWAPVPRERKCRGGALTTVRVISHEAQESPVERHLCVRSSRGRKENVGYACLFYKRRWGIAHAKLKREVKHPFSSKTAAGAAAEP
jgi:hypothetical protein